MNPFQKFDKQIYFIKVIVGEACPFRCKYCFVDKESPDVIHKETLRKIIDLLLYSPGNNKLLHLLGGEPLLFWDIIKDAILYARELQKKVDKDLDISFCTTGLLFDEEKLKFIAQHNIHLAWSIDGPKEIHDRNRVALNKKGTFDDIIVKKDMVMEHIKKTHLGIAMTIDTNTTFELFDSYKYLVDEEGFDTTINIAPVDGKIWEKKAEKEFINQIVQVYEYLLENIEKGRFLYLNALNKEFRFYMLSTFRRDGGRCLWFYTEAFPNGDILFNPFVNKEEDYSQYVVGNINDDTFMSDIEKYLGCSFDQNSEICNTCKGEYFNSIRQGSENIQLNKLLYYRDRVSVHYANKIRIRAKNEPYFAKYMQKAKDMMYV